MRLRTAAIMAGIALGLMSGTAKASYIINVFQSGNNVVASGSGSLSLLGLTLVGSTTGPTATQPNLGYLVIGVPEITNIYSGFTGPDNFGPGNGVFANSYTGNQFGISVFQNLIGVPQTFAGGDAGSSSATFNNTTLASLGLVDGRYVYQWSSDSLIVSVGTVPLPASAPMFGAGLVALGAAGYGLKRKKASVA